MKQIKRVVSGITPSGNQLHIGNFFGAIKPQLELQENIDETYYFIADLHALTTIKNKEILEGNIVSVVMDYLALGLDPNKSIFFRQSDVAAHSQLTVVLANYVSYGQMQRMHAYKDKLVKGADEESINMGLFNYPILMAADILAYKPDGVPVGEDQKQHVEITRDIAEKFNKTYKKEVFPLPEAIISKETGRVVGTDGVRKMSKSLGNIIGIFESEEVIRKQIMGCFTDPNRKKATDPGVVENNPVFIYHDLINTNKDEVNDLKARYRKGTVGDVEVKQLLIEAHQRYFAGAREYRARLVENPKMVSDLLIKGAEKASKAANANLYSVYETIGINNLLNEK
jgi:tryptophanyl-tRNA synthetase